MVGADAGEVAQFLEQGRADVALLPGSAMRAYQLGGRMQQLPIASKVYTPVRKGAGVFTRSKHSRTALEFLKFAGSSEGRAIFRHAGFDVPRRSAAGKH